MHPMGMPKMLQDVLKKIYSDERLMKFSGLGGREG